MCDLRNFIIHIKCQDVNIPREFLIVLGPDRNLNKGIESSELRRQRI